MKISTQEMFLYNSLLITLAMLITPPVYIQA